MSCIENANRAIIPNDVIASLTEIYRYIGKSDNYYKVTINDYDRIVSQTIERDTFFLAKLVGLDITDNRLRLIITKNSSPRSNDERVLYTIKELLTEFMANPNKLGLDSVSLLNLENYIYPKNGIKYDLRRINPNESGKTKREIIQEIGEMYENSLKTGSVERIILLINYFIDLTALKPFTERNELVPYLVLYGLLKRSNVNALSYVSLFEKIYFSKDEFDSELKNSCNNWEECYHQTLPFVRYFINLLKELFKHCDRIITNYEDDLNINKGDNIENTIMNLPNMFTKEEVRLNHPYVSESTINRALKKLHEEGIIRPLGKGRSAKWLKVGFK